MLADIENLQVDNEGFLKLRVKFGKAGTALDPNDITGVAAMGDYLFVLRSDRTLWLQHFDGSTITARRIRGVGDDLEGRISIVAPGADYVILTSEGMDQGYWINLNRSSNDYIVAHSLGISPPPNPDEDMTITVEGSTERGYLGSGAIGYVFLWLRQANAQPFDGMESNSSGILKQEITQQSGSLFSKVVIKDVKFPDDNQVTHLAIYRTENLGKSNLQISDLAREEFQTYWAGG